jgi:two-component system response regulator RegX3
MSRVLIVEDEPAYVDALEVALGQEGFAVESAVDGRAGLAAFRALEPDLVLLDLMLPVVSGLDVLRSIRVVSAVPVIVVSAKDAEADVVAALELGADDYLRKPYSVRELVARIRVALRRPTSDEPGSEVLEVGTATLDTGRYQLRVVFDLPRKEFEVMEMLMGHAGVVVTRDELLSDVWGITWSDSKTLDQHIRRLRRKLETTEDAPTIATIRGVGYRLEP